MHYYTLTPAYNRDYKSKAAIQVDLDADKDFILQPDGRYINKAQLVELGAKQVNVRYQKMTKVTVIKL